MADEINFNDDRISVEEIVTRFEELDSLKSDVEDAQAEYDEAQTDVTLATHGDGDTTGELAERVTTTLAALDRAQSYFTVEERVELDTLTRVLGELKGYGGDYQWQGDWYPSDLINEGHFTEAMKEMTADIGDLPRNLPDYIEIDWEATAKNLKVDYSEIEVDGTKFYYR